MVGWKRYLVRSLPFLASLSLIDVGVSLFGWSYRRLDLTLQGTINLVVWSLAVTLIVLGLVEGFFALWRARRWVTWFRYWLRKLGHNMVPRQMPWELDVENEPEPPEPPEPQFLLIRSMVGLPPDFEKETKPLLRLTALVMVVSVAPSLVGVTLLQITTPFPLWLAIAAVNLPLAMAGSLILSLGHRSRRLAGEADAEEARHAEEHAVLLNRLVWHDVRLLWYYIRRGDK